MFVIRENLVPNGTYLSQKMHIILVNSSLRGTKQSLADRHQTLIDCRATARNDGDFGLSKCHSYLTLFFIDLFFLLFVKDRAGLEAIRRIGPMNLLREVSIGSVEDPTTQS